MQFMIRNYDFSKINTSIPLFEYFILYMECIHCNWMPILEPTHLISNI
jgi:hypothetical protein